MGRTPCCNAEGLRKGVWSADEDQKLIAYIREHGEGRWRTLPQKAGLSRCGKSCRLRWINYLSPDIKRGELNPEEEQKIIRLHAILGNRCSHLPKRTDNEIKNYWNTHLKKKLLKMGVDPTTHKPLGPTPPVSTCPSRPISRSAHLLNRVATKLAPFGCLETVHSMAASSVSATTTTTTTTTAEGLNNDCPEPKSSSTSAKLLNKMATRLDSIGTLKSILLTKSANVGPTDCNTTKAETLKQIKHIGAESSGSDALDNDAGINFKPPEYSTTTSTSSLSFSDSLDSLNDWVWEVFFPDNANSEGDGGGGDGDSGISDVSHSMETSAFYLNNRSTTIPEFDSLGACENENEPFITGERQGEYSFVDHSHHFDLFM